MIARTCATNQKPRVVYAGLHVPTLQLLRETETISLVGIARSKAFNANRHQSAILSSVDTSMPALDFDDPTRTAATIRKLNADLLIINVWDIVPKEVLAAFRLGAINVHPSLLPKYRGALPTLWSLRNHDTETGVTFSVVGDVVDGGGILRQVRFSISSRDNWSTIEHKVDAVVRDHLCRVISDYLSGNALIREQLLEGATFTPKYEAYRRIVPGTETMSEVINKAGYYPYWDTNVYAYLPVGGRDISIKRIRKAHSQTTSPPASAAGWSMRGMRLIVTCKDGALTSRLFIDISLMDSLSVIRSYYRRRQDAKCSG